MSNPESPSLNARWRWLTPLLIAVFALPLLAHMLAGFYSRMMADDYCTTLYGRDYGMIDGFLLQYNTWGGQPMNIGFKNLVGMVGIALIPLLPAAIIVSWALALVWMLRQMIAPARASLTLIVLAGLALLFVMLDGTPVIIQSVYWLAANVPYTMPLILAALIIGLLARQWRLRRAPRLITIIVMAALCFFAGGFAESYMALQLGSLMCGIVISALQRDARRWLLPLLIAGLLASVPMALFMITAPGLTARRALFETPPLFESALQSLIYTIALTLLHLAVFTPIGTALALLLPALLGVRAPRAEKASRAFTATASIIVIAVASVGAFVFVGVYGTGSPPPARIYVLSQFAITLMLAFVGYQFAGNLVLPPRIIRLRWLPPVLLIALVALGPLRAAAQTLALLPTLQQHAAEWDARDALLRAHAESGASGIIHVPAFTVDVAQAVGLEPIDDIPDEGYNVCAAAYYHVEGIAAIAQ